MFKSRLNRPEKGNKYYITKNKGGYSSAIEGKPTDKDCNVLSNCVGYAFGRFNEIAQEPSMKYLKPVNAENFIQYRGNLSVGSTPKLGACMVWQKGDSLKASDGAGHVAIVEKVISDNEVITSESGYGSSKPFWTTTRKKNDGNWGQGTGYRFLGFIYNPAVIDIPKGKAEIMITFNGQEYSCIGTVENGTTYIRLRDLDEVLGVLNVSWNGKTAEVKKK